MNNETPLWSAFATPPQWPSVRSSGTETNFLGHPQPAVNLTSPSTKHDMPLVLDNVDINSISWKSWDPIIRLTTPGMPVPGSMDTQVSNLILVSLSTTSLLLPPMISAGLVLNVFLQFGNVISVRSFRDHMLNLVEFESEESAVQAKETLNYRPLLNNEDVVCHIEYVGVWPYQIANKNISSTNKTDSRSHRNSIDSVNSNNSRRSLLQEQLIKNGIILDDNEPPYGAQLPPAIHDCIDTFHNVMSSFDTHYDESKTQSILRHALHLSSTDSTDSQITIRTDYSTNASSDLREFLRDIKQILENSTLIDQVTIDQLIMFLLPNLSALCYEPASNTLIQKLFDKASVIIKNIMLTQLCSEMPSLGIHKNGTWVCQKLIKGSNSPRMYKYIIEGISPKCIALCQDQYGNYVIQSILNYQFPWNNFIFSNMLSGFWNIVRNKFGVRAVRACLETESVITNEQTLLLSTMIVVYSRYLITDPNGTLLITWYLDSCLYSNRYELIVNEIMPHLEALCCHKLGSLTVLRILTARGEQISKKRIIEGIFGDLDHGKVPDLLRNLLLEGDIGPTFLYKVISSRILDELDNDIVKKRVHDTILQFSIDPHNRKLIDKVGLTMSNASIMPQRKNSGYKYRTPPSDKVNNRGPPVRSNQTQATLHSQQTSGNTVWPLQGSGSKCFDATASANSLFITPPSSIPNSHVSSVENKVNGTYRYQDLDGSFSNFRGEKIFSIRNDQGSSDLKEPTPSNTLASILWVPKSKSNMPTQNGTVN